MTKVLTMFCLLLTLVTPTYALEISVPEVPKSAEEWMPQQTESFGDGLIEILKKLIKQIRPDLGDATQVCISLIAAVMIVSILQTFCSNTHAADLAGTTVIALLLMNNANAMLCLGADTVRNMSEYGKLLFPVMTTAMAAQGGITGSAALYAGTSIFNTFLCNLISNYLLPLISFFLALAVANHALGEATLKKLADMVKNTMSWCLKTLMIIFTTYLSITGVISGTTDAAALKATKVMISSVVPVVGGILSDASEAVLVSAELMKNAAGLYGIFAILALFLAPFVKIGLHYYLLKATGILCGIFGTKNMSGLIEDFSSAMGLVLAMTGAVCLLLLISTICFMKGFG